MPVLVGSELAVALSSADAKTGNISTRTSATVGTLTLAASHGITTGLTIDMSWAGGNRAGVAVGTVAVDSVPITGGTGDDLPTADTAVTVVAAGTFTTIAAGVSASIKTYLGFDPAIAGLRTEYFDTLGGDLLPLNHGPVSSVTSVYEAWDWWQSGAYGTGSDPFPATTLLTVGTDYALRTDAGSRQGVLVRIGRLWPVSSIRPVNRLAGVLSPARGCVKCTYTVDDSGALAVAKQAAIFEGVAQYRTVFAGIGTITSDSMNSASVSVTVQQRRGNDSRDSFVSPIVASLLRPFKRTLL